MFGMEASATTQNNTDLLDSREGFASNGEQIQLFVRGSAIDPVLSVEVCTSVTVWEVITLLRQERPEFLRELDDIPCKQRPERTALTLAGRPVPCYYSIGELGITSGSVLDVSPVVVGGIPRERPRIKLRYPQENVRKMERFADAMRKCKDSLVRSVFTRNIGVKICRKCNRRNPVANRTCRSRSCGHSNIFRPKKMHPKNKTSIVGNLIWYVQKSMRVWGLDFSAEVRLRWRAAT